MSPLETTIVKQAQHELDNLRRALLMPVGTERVEIISSSFWMLSGLTMLACVAESGMSTDAAQELNKIDREAGQAIAAAGLVGQIQGHKPV